MIAQIKFRQASVRHSVYHFCSYYLLVNKRIHQINA